jgi:hypothetical protein
MEVLDREKEPGNQLLGRASVLLDEIRRMPSSRQIIPLTGKPRSRTSTSGSVTVEFVFMDTNIKPQTSKDSLQNSPGSYIAESPIRYQEKAEMQGVRVNDSPTVVVTGVEQQKYNTLQPSYLNSGGVQDVTPKKKESFATALKNKFKKIKQPRSQSADRATGRQPPNEGNLLKLPSDRSATLQTSNSGQQGSNTAIAGGSQTFETDASRKPRSNSFSSSLRRMFKRDKKDASRESSISRPSANDPYNRNLSSSQQEVLDRSRRQNTPVPPDIQYSTSVPSAPSPLHIR